MLVTSHMLVMRCKIVSHFALLFVLCTLVRHFTDYLWNAWKKDRIEYYQRMEPNQPPYNACPTPPTGGCRRLTLRGEESNMIWSTLLTGNHENIIKVWNEKSAQFLV